MTRPDQPPIPRRTRLAIGRVGAAVALISALAPLTLAAESIPAFEDLTFPPAFNLNGAGSNVDSIAFWEPPDPRDTLMIVTGKSNDRLEVYRHPFVDNELDPVLFPANVNGVAVDQPADRLYVTDRIVSVLDLPGLELQSEFGQGIIGVGENNLDILVHADGRTLIYVSDDHNVHIFEAATQEHIGSFAPPVSSIETILADDFYQMILVPEEQGPEGNPGVFAFHPDGAPFERGGTNRFGNDGEFDSDEEGILLYTFPPDGRTDDGTGFIVISDQRSDVTDFEFFDRQTWAHLGRIRLEGVSNTDGIASTQTALPGYPMGIFAAIDDDSSTAGLGWDVIFAAMGLPTDPRVLSITPVTAGLTAGPHGGGQVDFTVVFSVPVANFDQAGDLEVTYDGTASTGASIEAADGGEGRTFSVALTGVSGEGSITLAVSTGSDVQDLTANPLASGGSSGPVAIVAPYAGWAGARGLSPGVDDGPGDDPDRDGRPNLLEFATGGDPLNGGADGARLRVSAPPGVGGGAARFLHFTIPVLDGAAFTPAADGSGALTAAAAGVTYRVEGSRDLLGFVLTVEEVSPALADGLPGLEGGWNYRSFRVDSDLAEAGPAFIRLAVAQSGTGAP